MRVLVLGAGGQLGAAIVHECSAAHIVAAFDRQALDITDEEAVRRAAASFHPDVIVNCAAYTAVDAAEDQPEAAFQVNSFAVRGLARIARESGITLVHYSTDFVFDGTADSPYTEEVQPNPRSVYAMSKMLGEWFAADAPKAYVLRVETLLGRAPAGPPPKGGAYHIVNALRSGARIAIHADRTISPTHVADAARATRELIERGVPPGLYHCVNSESCTWLEFALEAARLLNVPDPKFDLLKYADLSLRARRPQYCALSNAKLARAGIAMPSWKDALRRFLADDLSD